MKGNSKKRKSHPNIHQLLKPFLGMGLVSEAIATELGYLTRDEGVARVRLTLETLLTHWPRDSHSGFMVHFTNRNWDALSEFSTIDTTELVLGALFAGNYFGNDISVMATILLESVKWSDAIKAADNPRIFPIVNANTGVFSGNIRPYNEYYLVAYLANLTSLANSKAKICTKFSKDYPNSLCICQSRATYNFIYRLF